MLFTNHNNVETSSFLLFLLLHAIPALAQEFDAFDRKVFKSRKVRYASFDKQGILTLDGTLNGKSNDIVFPNAEGSEVNQEMCNKEPKLVFELCEMQKYGAWTGLAICYESQLSQPYINPFFRVQTAKSHVTLMKVMCGPKRSAIFIGRETRKSDEADCAKKGHYDPLYSISTSFSPEMPIYFKMPNQTEEKSCAILELGGQNLLGVSLMNMRREKLDMYRNLERDKWEEEDFLQTIPDLANRKFKISKKQGPWFLLLDFSPPFGVVQNISVYGWLPLKIKITGMSIKPCMVDWQLLQSREVSGGLTAKKLQIKYVVNTGLTNTVSESEGSNNGTSEENTDSDSVGVSANAGNAGAQEIARNDKAQRKAMGRRKQGGKMALLRKMPTIAISASHSVQNTHGYMNSNEDFENIGKQFSEDKTVTRVDVITFEDFVGTVNIEQLVFTCHGIQIRPDQIRYQDPDGNPLLPESINFQDVKERDNEILADAIIREATADKCLDNAYECPIWAGQGECRKSSIAFMLTRCKYSCKMCPKVDVERKNKLQLSGAEQEQQYDGPCMDRHQYCPVFAEQRLCQKDPLLMSSYCRFSCGLCVSEEDAYYQLKENLDQEDGL